MMTETIDAEEWGRIADRMGDQVEQRRIRLMNSYQALYENVALGAPVEKLDPILDDLEKMIVWLIEVSHDHED